MLRSSRASFFRASGTTSSEIVAVAMGVARTLLGKVPPNRGDHSWADSLIGSAKASIFGSSHLAQVALNWLSSTSLVAAAPVKTAAAMQLAARSMGLLYVVAVWSWARTLEGVDRTIFLVVGIFCTPVTVYFTGYQEIGFYALPFALIGLRLAARAGILGAAIAGLGAAFHGLGFFFLPAFVAPAPRRLSRLPRWVADCAARALAFFGPNGVAFLGYLLLFPGATITPGDAHGGKNGSLLLELSYRRDGHYLLQGKVVLIALELLLLTAPAFFVLVGAAAVARPRPRLRELPPLLVLGATGFAFAVLFNPNPWWDAIYDFDMYAAALAPLQLASTLTSMALLPARRPLGAATRVALIVVSGAVTLIFDRWIHTRVLGIPHVVEPISLIWYPTTAPMK